MSFLRLHSARHSNIQVDDEVITFKRMFSNRAERSLSRSKSRRWKQVRANTVLLIASVLALAASAWAFLVFSTRRQCFHVAQNWKGGPLAFPWVPPEPDHQHQESNRSTRVWLRPSMNTTTNLNISNLVFGIAGSAQLWPRRKEYVKLWWRPGEMRGFVWLEEAVEHEPYEPLLPNVLVSEDISRFIYTNPTGHPAGIRLARIVQEVFRLNLPDVHWFVMGDDDTVFSPDNLLRILKKYDSRELFYIGNPSESHSSNTYFSHGMAFGGGGIAISYPLAKALSNMLDDCLERYPFLFGSDDRLHACITELGVPLTREPGFHQFDIHGNAFGLLAGHPISPFISMHHLDELEPVFPQYNAMDGLRHLTKSMRTEPSTFLQRCICYDQKRRLTFSISSGYVVQVYPDVVLPRELERSEITFKAWNTRDDGGEFDFDTRMAIKSECNKPFLFFLEDIHVEGTNVVSVYKRHTNIDNRKRRSFCFSHMNHQKHVQEIHVVSKSMSEHWFKVPRRQCCKVMVVEGPELGIRVGPCEARRSSSVEDLHLQH